ncbi:MAG: 3-oxoacyl-ACP reductase [Burkholderiaceae bacterium]|nr:3-oxoacyl-ACP reductase [Burkholderiaceae bacterium]
MNTWHQGSAPTPVSPTGIDAAPSARARRERVADRYVHFANSALGKRLTSALGLPQPAVLRRWHPGDSEFPGPVIVESSPRSRLGGRVTQLLEGLGAAVASSARSDVVKSVHALVFDATDIEDSTQLIRFYSFFHPRLRSLAACGRVVVLGCAPQQADTPAQAIAQRALEGAVRSLAKELRQGATAQLIYVDRGAETALESTLRFFLTARSAFVSGQSVRISVPVDGVTRWERSRPLSGRTAVVTGASRGIGEAIVRVLAREGARVIGVDVPAAQAPLRTVCEGVGGQALVLDVTADDAASRMAEAAGGCIDIMVHNAGITRDKRLVNMREDQWHSVIQVNLVAQERSTEQLLRQKALRQGARVICVSSMSGVAGNAGQVNYAASKAGVIGLVQSYAPTLAREGITINAVAPGFIETQMTAEMPFAIREAGRRLNSLGQGGQPVDVAEAIAWLAHPGSGGVIGQVVRVCGQNWLGA